MKHTIRKAYFNYEKEEKWLNEMAAKGMALTNYSSWRFRYVFEDCRPGEYIYRIELLQKRPSHPESINYMRFLEETGIEHIPKEFRWGYFRRKASDGPFEIYSDIDSKIKHYSRVNAYIMSLGILNLALAASNVVLTISNLRRELIYHVIDNYIVSGIGVAVSILCFTVSHPHRKKVKKLKQEKNVIE
jgi:hypothetical protein